MRRFAAGLVVAATLAVAAGPAYADHQGGRCEGREGNCNDQRRCSGDDCTDNHRAFSPTFDKSPVDHSFNFSPTVCVMPGSCTDKNPPSDKQPAGFFPPSPGKIPGQIQAFVKLTFDFVQGVFAFAV